MLEIAKLLATLLGGGLAGALLNEWFRRRRSRVHRIPLIERVNRQVSPELEGITLARIVSASTVGTSTKRELEELKNLREYQLTMRNNSSTHLQDAEVQFEFPADDVQAWASRPALSKTALVELEATAIAPWKKAFRWRIPHLPSGDSVEFTFRAVDPSSESYEAALYHSEGVVFERIVGEPSPAREAFAVRISDLAALLTIVAALGVAFFSYSDLYRIRREKSATPEKTAAPEKLTPPEKVTTIKLAGCNLHVTSSSEQEHDGPWFLRTQILNLGAQVCLIQSEKMNFAKPTSIRPGGLEATARFSEGEPKLLDAEISVHAPDISPATTTASVYVAP